MPILNLTAENDCQQAIKDYLAANASDILAEKINNGVQIEKDGKTLINKKTLSQFWEYASKKAQELKTGYAKNETVFGWAIHYFEESDIIGTLYNDDGTKYAPPKPEYKPVQRVPAPSVQAKPTPPKPQQFNLFDMLTQEKKEEPVIEDTTVDTDNDIDEETPNELNIDTETGEVLNANPIIKYKPTTLYQKYLNIEKQYPHAVVVYRLGDFYEIFGDKAVVVSRELELTLTSRDCGLAKRVPMIGFPYHASDSYFNKIRQRRKVIVIENEDIKVLEKLSIETSTQKTVSAPSLDETISISNDNIDEDIQELREQSKHIDKEALCILIELFDGLLDVQ